MIPCPPPVALAAPPPLFPTPTDWEATLWALLALVGSALFALLRASLVTARPARVLEGARTERRKRRLEPLLGDVDRLVTSAAILHVTSDLLFLTILLAAVSSDGALGWNEIGLAVAVAVPTLLLLTEALPYALAQRHGDRLLSAVLPSFHVLQLPLRALVLALDTARRMLLRVFGVEESSPEARRIVEELRNVVEDSGRSEELDETERELIENVMEFRDVDVAAVMTPRTEIDGIDIDAGLAAAVKLASDTGHSRVPVYEGSLDNIVGYVSARGIVQALAADTYEQDALRRHLQPAYFVPETKQITDLLADFRRERQKMAIVLDEYGGTAGLVTLGDVLEEIVGEIQDEFDRESPQVVREVEPGVADVDASLHVSEVNEALGLQLPEESDFETLAGYVLAALGHFPKRGETFERDGVEFEVREASDRRVIEVRVHHGRSLSDARR